MTAQLSLIDPNPRRSFRLDARTRAIGRQGVARARIVLERARPAIDEQPLRQAG
ncbi:MAG: hypothetical protein ACRDY7_18650 [Acidimicrobiia bacterium]